MLAKEGVQARAHYHRRSGGGDKTRPPRPAAIKDGFGLLIAAHFLYCAWVISWRIRPMSIFQRSIQVRYQLRVHFTQNVFDPVNPVLAEVLLKGENSTSKALIVLD